MTTKPATEGRFNELRTALARQMRLAREAMRAAVASPDAPGYGEVRLSEREQYEQLKTLTVPEALAKLSQLTDEHGLEGITQFNRFWAHRQRLLAEYGPGGPKAQSQARSEPGHQENEL